MPKGRDHPVPSLPRSPGLGERVPLTPPNSDARIPSEHTGFRLSGAHVVILAVNFTDTAACSPFHWRSVPG